MITPKKMVASHVTIIVAVVCSLSTTTTKVTELLIKILSPRQHGEVNVMNQKDRFTIEPSITNSIRWKVKDNVSGISVSFLEGCYMDNSLYVPDTMKGEEKKEEGSETLKKSRNG